MPLSYQQEVALAVVPKVSSVFSLFGSIWIIVEVATEKTKRGVPYHRLLLAMSVYDVLESVWNFLSTWPIPKGSPDVIWNFGNTGTCTAQGFFLTLSSAVPLYNAMLSWYYVLVINYNYSDTRLRGFVEPAMHTFCFVWAFGTALYSALAGLLNNADLWCWIAPLPADCKDSWTHGSGPENDNPCIRGDNVWIYRFGFYFIPLWMSIAVATVSTYMVWKYVFHQDKKTLRYRRPQRTMSLWKNGMKSFRNDVKKRFSPAVPVSGGSNLGQIVESDAEEEEVGDEHEKGKESHPSVQKKELLDANKKATSPDRSLGALSKTKELDAVGDIPGAYGVSSAPPDRNSGGSHLLAKDRKDPSSLGLRSVPESSEGVYHHSDDMSKQRSSLEDNTPHNLKHSMRELSEDRQPTGAWSLSMKRLERSQSSSVRSIESCDISAAQDELAKRKQKAESEANERIERREAKKANGLLARWKEWKEKREQYAQDMPHTVEVFHQACFYLGAFYCTHVWSTTNRIVQTITGGDSVFFLLVMHAFFDPFQGFLNYLVYQRPRYIQMRKKFPDLSVWKICLVILRFSYMGEYVIPPIQSSTEASE
ncbi:unnamed protein product [Cylindrotheca closterium]|uniref:G-protein coupled receptors family 2 profile 2 domain-containing protein n=1 Tax=Cylindrotheca closterium TaxID=2856 RepID=A0AAD2FWU7_9STRA|nr:unnamed protein product [Cylindrotheca closterium]